MFDRFKPRMIKFPENPQDSSSSKARRGARLWTPDRDEHKDAASVEEGSLDDVETAPLFSPEELACRLAN